MKDGGREPSWPEGFVWSDEYERPVYSPQRGDASGEASRSGAVVAAEASATGVPQCHCKWGASGAHVVGCPCDEGGGEGTMNQDRLAWLAASLDAVVSWPTEPEVNDWHFEPNEAEFVALATPKRIHALAAELEATREALREAEAFVEDVTFRAPFADAAGVRLLARIRAALAGGEQT